ncbi:MAG: arginine decarboxylase, partial [Lachnospiraceae bacterium]|nr:arginine decarboxylase [Lachnospiraceae bacterium]
ENLKLVQSTSPSYLLMISLDCARYELAMHGREMYQKAAELAAYARMKINAIEGFACLEMMKSDAADSTRLVISARELGISGFALDEMLFSQYHVNVELSDHENVLAIVTYANEKEELDRLIYACSSIGAEYGGKDKKNKQKNDIGVIKKQLCFSSLPEQCMTPRRAYFSKKKRIAWQEAVGAVSGQVIAPYPPGIPVIYPGERISREAWEYIECFRRDGRHIHGANRDGVLDSIQIIE